MFLSRYDQFKFWVMSFDLTNAPTIFMDLMNHVFSLCWTNMSLSSLTTSWCILRHLKSTPFTWPKFWRLSCEHCLYAKFSKCSFWLGRISFLGHMVSSEGISVDPSMVQAVINWSKLTNIVEVRSFLGLAGYYWCFIEGFSWIAAPLTQLTKKRFFFNWDSEYEESFLELKCWLTTTHLLILLNNIGFLQVYCDESCVCFGCVLIQHGRVVAYGFRQLKPYKDNYVAQDLKLVTIIFVLKIWHYYLYGQTFEIYMNYKSLKYLFSHKELNMR